jgi:hypothetical protein
LSCIHQTTGTSSAVSPILPGPSNEFKFRQSKEHSYELTTEQELAISKKTRRRRKRKKKEEEDNLLKQSEIVW